MKLNILWQTILYFFGKINYHHFAGRLVIHEQNTVSAIAKFLSQFNVWCVFIENGGVVKHIYNFFFYNIFKVGKIYNHPEFYVSVICNWIANYGYRKLIAVAVHISAFAIVAVKCVAGFKRKNLGDSNLFHKKMLGTKIQFSAPAICLTAFEKKWGFN